jgi:cell division protein FtsL
VEDLSRINTQNPWETKMKKLLMILLFVIVASSIGCINHSHRDEEKEQERKDLLERIEQAKKNLSRNAELEKIKVDNHEKYHRDTAEVLSRLIDVIDKVVTIQEEHAKMIKKIDEGKSKNWGISQ